MNNVDNKFVLRKSFKFITYLDSVEGKPIIFEVNRWWTGIHSIWCSSFTVSRHCRQSMWQLYHVDGFIICKQCKPVKVHPRILKKVHWVYNIRWSEYRWGETCFLPSVGDQNSPALGIATLGLFLFLSTALQRYRWRWMPSRISLYTVPADPSAGCCASPCSRWSPRPCHSAASPGFLSASLDTDL